MNLAKVLGTVVSTKKSDRISGLRLLMLGTYGPDNKPTGGSVVAADDVGAGIGEMVLYASGSSARQTAATDNRPIDAVIMAIVDCWDIDGADVYKKGRDD